MNRVVGVVALSFACALCFAQGGQGGGGGFQGGAGGTAGQAGEGSNTYEHILTPGTNAEWPIEAKEGDSIIAKASSEVFDPGMEVVDESGKVLMEIDDIAPGVQEASLAFRFPAAGKYKILVKGFKSAAGGPYTITLTRFNSKQTQYGATEKGMTNPNKDSWFAFPAKKGDQIMVSAMVPNSSPNAYLITPLGQDLRATRTYHSGLERRVFSIPQDGTYFARVDTTTTRENPFEVSISKATLKTTRVGEDATSTLKPNAFEIWNVEVKAGQVLKFSASNDAKSIDFSPQLASSSDTTAEVVTYERDVLLLMSRDAKIGNSATYLIKKDAVIQVNALDRDNKATDYKLSIQNVLKELPASGKLDSRIAISQAEFWAFQGAQGQILDLTAMAETFDIEMNLFTIGGRPVASGASRTGEIDDRLRVVLDETTQYVLVFNCEGSGGSGPYSVQRQEVKPPSLKLGSPTNAEFDDTKLNMWQVEAKAGQTLIISVASEEFDTWMTVFSRTGRVLANATDGGAGTNSLVVIKITEDGPLTLKVGSQRGEGKYVIKVLDLDAG